MKRILTIFVFCLAAITSWSQEKSFYQIVQEVKAKRSAYGPYPKDSSKLKALLPKDERMKKVEELRNSQWPYGRTRIVDDPSHKVVIYASPDPENEGEVLVYYYLPNFRDFRADSIFVVMNKATCHQMAASFREADRKLREWKKIAKKNDVDKYTDELGVAFPEVNIYWQKLRPPHGEYFYMPWYMWSGPGNWLVPIGHISKGGDGGLEFNFLLPDFDRDEDYPVKIYMDVTGRRYLMKYLDYEGIKKKFRELNPDRSHYQELFK